jgi:hypothetical protein
MAQDAIGHIFAGGDIDSVVNAGLNVGGSRRGAAP